MNSSYRLIFDNYYGEKIMYACFAAFILNILLQPVSEELIEYELFLTFIGSMGTGC